MRRASVIGLLSLVLCPAAIASSVLPQGQPVEPLLGQIASSIAGGPVSVACDADESISRVGYTLPGQIHLSRGTCDSLTEYAAASPKPTMCATTKAVTIRYRKTVRVKRHGHYVKKRVWRKKHVRRDASPVPCYTEVVGLSVHEPVGVRYALLVTSLQGLAHESVHARDFRLGLPTSETHAECAGMQALPGVVVTLGGTPQEGKAVLDYYVKNIRSHYTDPAYTAPC